MTIDTSQFSKVADFGNIRKLERQVKTPMPENEDDSGYTVEENRKVVYEIGEFYVEVSKVTDRGWSVTRYDPDGFDKMDMTYYEEEAEAHRIARKMVEEVAE